ncbi:MlaD family protein [Flavobacterium sp.]|uniref:MlaD family protein n=2 Tax=Flavobacterium sp. TaxID=239 RepID=UPI004048B556
MIKFNKFYYILMTFMFVACKNIDSEYRFFVLFENVKSLSNNSNIYCKGLKIGNVKSMSINNNRVLVELKINNDIKITTGSKFYIKNLGLIDGVSIDVLLDSISKTYIKSNDTIIGYIKEESDIDKLIDLINKE